MRNRSATLSLLIASAAVATAAADTHFRQDFRGHHGAINSISFGPDSNLIASTSVEPEIMVWNIDTRTRVCTLSPHGRTVTADTPAILTTRRIESIDFSPDGKLIAEAVAESSMAGAVRLWNLETREPERVLIDDARNLRAVAFSPDGKLLAANMRDGYRSDHKIVLYNPETGDTVAELRGERLSATLLAFTPDGQTLISAGGTRIHIWDLTTYKLRDTITTHKKGISVLAVAPDGKTFATGDSDETIRIWHTDTAKLDREIKHKQEGVCSLAYHPSGLILASGGEDNTIKLWNPANGRRRDPVLWRHTGKVTALDFSPDGKYLASGSRDTTLAIYDVQVPAADDEGVEEKDSDDDAKDKKRRRP